MGESKILQNVNMRPLTHRPPMAVIWIMGLLAIAGRLALFPYVSENSMIFLLPWMQEFRDHGAALGGEFSNYNFPYLFLMFLGSLLPVEPLFAIKLISMAGDFLLAYAVAAVVAQLPSTRLAPETAALTALSCPRCHERQHVGAMRFHLQFFSASCLRSVVRGDARGAWLWWAAALSFKLQAVFFLPALVPIALRNRHSLGLPAIAGCLWALLSVPPVLFGR